LTPAFYRQGWEAVDKLKRRRRKMTTSVLSMDDLSMDVTGDDKMDQDIAQDEDEGDLLDIYVCCQCSLYCVVSDVIPGVIPVGLLEQFTRNKRDNPAIDRSAEESIVIGWETILTYVLYSRI
jgi:ubiquitin carboxyl-terminal hydrolase 25/28